MKMETTFNPAIPRCWIEVIGMTHDPQIPAEVTQHGFWEPSKDQFVNIRLPNERHLFFSDGYRLFPIEQPAIIDAQVPSSTISLYCTNSSFLAIDYDATRYPIADGRFYDANLTRPPTARRPYMNWSRLTFTPFSNLMSMVSLRGQVGAMTVWRPDQIWRPRLLPHNYWGVRTDAPRPAGALTGSLTLMMALIAMSVGPHQIVEHFNRYQQGIWDWDWSPDDPNTRYWYDYRGVVVNLYQFFEDDGSTALSRRDLKDFTVALP